MSIATLTSKGQVTIPLAVRQDAGLVAGDQVNFVRESAGRYVLVPKAHSVKSLKGIVAKPAYPTSIQDMEDAIVQGALA